MDHGRRVWGQLVRPEGSRAAAAVDPYNRHDAGSLAGWAGLLLAVIATAQADARRGSPEARQWLKDQEIPIAQAADAPPRKTTERPPS